MFAASAARAEGKRQPHLSDGALADLGGHRLKLRICGQIEFVVPQELKETTAHHFLPLTSKSHDTLGAFSLVNLCLELLPRHYRYLLTDTLLIFSPSHPTAAATLSGPKVGHEDLANTATVPLCSRSCGSVQAHAATLKHRTDKIRVSICPLKGGTRPPSSRVFRTETLLLLLPRCKWWKLA